MFYNPLKSVHWDIIVIFTVLTISGSTGLIVFSIFQYYNNQIYLIVALLLHLIGFTMMGIVLSRLLRMIREAENNVNRTRPFYIPELTVVTQRV
jgi:hypothetical protein